MITVIIPIYNEQKAIRETLNQVKNTMSGKDFEIICVNDGSKDQSLKILNSISDITIINHPYNMGYGASLKSGIKKATVNGF